MVIIVYMCFVWCVIPTSTPHISYSSYHVISARGCSGHSRTVRRISNKCLTMRDLTPKPSLVFNYVFVAAAGKYTCPWMICYPYVLLALIMFDTLLSLPSESKYIWCQKPILGSILYILACYSTLGVLLIESYTNLFVISLQVCENKGSSMTFMLTGVYI